MNTLANFEVIGRRAFFRPVGNVTFERAVMMVSESLALTRSLGLADILVNSTGLTGFPAPSIFSRHAFAVKWAEIMGGSGIRVAVVARPEIIDPDKIGMLMAQNRGVSADVFTTELAALAWLDSHTGKSATIP
jgi:hypothetical protein